MKNRLNQICQSCGCKNIVIRETPKGPKAFVHFYNADDANRAKNKLNGEEIYNSKIRAFIDDNRTSNGHQPFEKFKKNVTLERQKSNESKAKGQNNGRQKQQVRAMDMVPTLGSFGDLQLLSFPQFGHPSNLLNLLDQVNSECEHRLLSKPEKRRKPRSRESISEDSNKPGGIQTNARQMQNQSNAKPNQDQNQGTKSKKEKEKEKKPKNSDVCSVITGLETTADQSPEELLAIVRSVVEGWNNDDYDPEFVKEVERNTRLKNKNGKVALFVTASSQGANRKLVNGANEFGFNDPSKYQSWTLYNDKPIDYNIECKSVIVGIKTTAQQNVTKLVREIVSKWEDSHINDNFIVNVERSAVFQNRDGEAALFVTAKDPSASKILVIEAKKHFNDPKNNIMWNKYVTPKKDGKEKGSNGSDNTTQMSE